MVEPIQEATPQISLDTTVPEQTPQISLDTLSNTLDPVAPEIAAVRAFKARYGLTNINQTYDQIYNQMVEGKEGKFRQDAASSVDIQKSKFKQDALSQLAWQKEGALRTDQIDYFQKQFKMLGKPTDPMSVVEEYFAKEVVNGMDRAQMNVGDTFLDQAWAEIPDEVRKTKNIASEIIAKREFLLKQAQDIHTVGEEQSWAGYLADLSKNLFPLYQDLKTRGLSPEAGYFAGGFRGSNLEAQAKDFLYLPFDEFKEKITPVIEKLKADNPGLAQAFVTAMLGRSSDDQFLDNVLNVIDLSSIPPLLKAAGPLAKIALFNQTRTAARQLVKDYTVNTPTKATIAEATGDVGEAIVQRATTEYKALQTSNPAKAASIQKRSAIDALPDVLRADRDDFAANPGSLGKDAELRIIADYNATVLRVSDVVTGTNKVQRFNPNLFDDTFMRRLKNGEADNSPGLQNQIIKTSIPYQNIDGTGYHVDYWLGKPGGNGLFPNKNLATRYAESHFAEYSIEPKGVGYYIKVTKPFNETDDILRDGLIRLKETQSPYVSPTEPLSWKKVFTSFFAKQRTPDEVLSEFQRQNRKVATYSPAKYYEAVAEDLKQINYLKTARTKGINPNDPLAPSWIRTTDEPGQVRSAKQRWQDWDRIVSSARDIHDPDTGLKGYFFKNPAELEYAYRRILKRAPDSMETEAYFAFKRVVETDRIFRNLNVYRNKIRVGVESHTVSVASATEGEGKLSITFDGVQRPKIPSGEGDNILVLGAKQGDENLVRVGSRKAEAATKKLEADVQAGRTKVIEVYDPELRPLANLGEGVAGARIRYVITPNVETKAIGFEQVPRRGGGHFDYDYEHYIKQAKVNLDVVGNTFLHWYEGDTTIMGVPVRALGVDVAGHLNEVRLLLKARNETAAKAYAQNNLPRFEWDELHSKFKSSHGPDGQKIPAQFSMDEPFQVVERNKAIVDTDNALRNRYMSVNRQTGVRESTFRDGTKQGSLARQYQVQYTGPRDAEELTAVADKGTRSKPVYEIENAKMLDPMSSMERGISRIVNSTFLDDYKTSAIEHWLREASPWLKSKEEALRFAPFHEFKVGEFKPNAPVETRRYLEAQRFQINQFVGLESDWGYSLHSMATKMADSVYSTVGPKGLVISPEWILPKLRDPFSFLRSVAFNAKLGLFNLSQLVVQSANYVNIYSIAGPGNAAAGTAATFMHQLSRINPTMVDAMDNTLTKLKIPGLAYWKPGEFKEAWEELRRTGFDKVGREQAVMDQRFKPGLIKNSWNDFLDAGQRPFKEAEMNQRLTSWYTAFREHRDKVPTGRITEIDRQTILDRADLLNANMSAASSSALHQGWLSIPATFYTYQLRMIEMMTGKRLTVAEKTRLFIGNSMMYGIPIGTGIFGNPFADKFRKSMIEQGYVPGENPFTTAAMEGIPATIGAIITGKGDIQAGTVFNVGERYGMKGFDPLNNLLAPILGTARTDKTIWEVATGAPGSIAWNTFKNSSGLMNTALSAVGGYLGRAEDKKYTPTWDDLVDAFKEISSVNNTAKLYAAVHTGKWVSKNETYLGDTSKAKAVFMSLTGMQDQSVSDLDKLSWIKKDRDDMMKYTEGLATKQIRRAMQSAIDNNAEQSNTFFRNANALLVVGGYPEEKVASFMRKALDDNRDIIDQLEQSVFMKNVPLGKEEKDLNTFITRQKLREKRGEQ